MKYRREASHSGFKTQVCLLRSFVSGCWNEPELCHFCKSIPGTIKGGKAVIYEYFSMRIAINFHKLRSAAIFVFTRMTVTFSSCWLVFVGEVSTTNEEDRWWFVFAFIWLCCRQGDFRFMRKVKGFYCPMAAKGLSHFFQKDKVKNSQLFIIYSRQTTSEFAFVSEYVCRPWTVVFWVTHCFLKCVRNIIKAVMFLFSVLDVPPEEETGDRDYALWTSQTIKGLLRSEKTQAALSCCLF